LCRVITTLDVSNQASHHFGIKVFARELLSLERPDYGFSFSAVFIRVRVKEQPCGGWAW